LVALRERDTTGKGQLVRSALFETAAFLMGHHMAYSAVSKEPVPPMPARVSAWAIYHQFETADNQRVFIGVTSDKQWEKFCQVFERNDWFNDARLKTNNDRITERDWFLSAVREMISKFDLAEILKRCEQAEIPFSPIAHPEDLFDDAQLNQGNGLISTLMPNGDKTKLPRLPIVLQEADLDSEAVLAKIGGNTNEILSNLGYSQQDIQFLKNDGSIA
jgi:crotonobetainyl-CoA:carnitine CoA-transferase CaiB-like acyl-CoA transferase